MLWTSCTNPQSGSQNIPWGMNFFWCNIFHYFDSQVDIVIQGVYINIVTKNISPSRVSVIALGVVSNLRLPNQKFNFICWSRSRSLPRSHFSGPSRNAPFPKGESVAWRPQKRVRGRILFLLIPKNVFPDILAGELLSVTGDYRLRRSNDKTD